jgi:hypothetical protein
MQDYLVNLAEFIDSKLDKKKLPIKLTNKILRKKSGIDEDDFVPYVQNILNQYNDENARYKVKPNPKGKGIVITVDHFLQRRASMMATIADASRCPDGMTLRRIELDNFVCDSCGGALRRGKEAYSCRTCNYDICKECRSMDVPEVTNRMDDSDDSDGLTEVFYITPQRGTSIAEFKKVFNDPPAIRVMAIHTNEDNSFFAEVKTSEAVLKQEKYQDMIEFQARKAGSYLPAADPEDTRAVFGYESSGVVVCNTEREILFSIESGNKTFQACISGGGPWELDEGIQKRTALRNLKNQFGLDMTEDDLRVRMETLGGARGYPAYHFLTKRFYKDQIKCGGLMFTWSQLYENRTHGWVVKYNDKFIPLRNDDVPFVFQNTVTLDPFIVQEEEMMKIQVHRQPESIMQRLINMESVFTTKAKEEEADDDEDTDGEGERTYDPERDKKILEEIGNLPPPEGFVLKTI